MSSVDRVPMLSWLTQRPDRGWLREHGFAVLPFDDLRKRFIELARGTGARRNTLDSPAQPLLDGFAGHQRVAVLEVRLETVQDLSDLHSYALEPAWRAGCRLIVQADRFLEDLDVTGFVDHAAGYAWTLERARWLAAEMMGATRPRPPYGGPAPSRMLDSEQLAAVAAHDGVVQVIAPAGSGKTTVLVQRVRELLRRRVPADRILCMTFNAAAAADLRERLDEAGVAGVEARTFHSVGRRILEKEGRLQGQTREPTLPQWRRLCAQASDETGEWIDPADARQKISDIKLGLLLTATEFAARATDDPQEQAAAWIYEAYEAEQRKAGQHDFDDQILLAVRAMRGEPGLRDRWQRLFDCVLVDEYQDIEPAQELLVRMLAAPQDSLFCVGDEDQVLYGWRRASAQRMVELDQVYPGLKRVALATNYRCPAAVVQCSRALIAHNTLRFPKRIEPGPRNSTDAAAVSLHRFEPGEAAGWTARALASRGRGEVVVLARTSRLLGQVALACVETGVLIAAPRRVFEATGARAVIEAHLRLAVQPEQATAEDVASVMRAPARGLRSGAGDLVASRLRNGAVWQAAVVGMGTDEGRIQRAAAEFDHLRTITDAPAFVRTLRASAGLDEHFERVERPLAPPSESRSRNSPTPSAKRRA